MTCRCGEKRGIASAVDAENTRLRTLGHIPIRLARSSSDRAVAVLGCTRCELVTELRTTLDHLGHREYHWVSITP